MAVVDPTALATEFKDDPQGYGYQAGQGSTFTEKQDGINLVRATIQVTRKAADAPIGPGEVSESIKVQLIRDAVDPDEYKLNCNTSGGETDDTRHDKLITALRINTFYGGSDGQSQFGFTTLSKAQILDLFSNAQWPSTRANMIALQTRDGTRAEQLFGSPDAPVTRDDMLAAEEVCQANGWPSLYT